jgi:iron complex outermembrane receptor protein
LFQQHPTGEVLIDASANDDWASWTPKVSIEYQIDSDYMVYASASRGFKSGGWNGRPTDEGGIQTYEEEFVWAYEVGFKTDWWNNRIRLNGAAYFNDYSDIQLVSSQADPETGVMRIVTENGGDAEIMGFELEITALPLPELRLSAGVGTLDFEYTDFARPNCAVAPLGTSCTRLEEGNVLPQAPELTFNLSAQYMVSLTNAAKVLLQGDYYYVDKFYVDPFNVEAIAAPSSEMINMRIAYVAPDDKWEVAAFVTNLTDEINIVNGFEVEAFGARAVTYSRPREWGLSVKYQY